MKKLSIVFALLLVLPDMTFAYLIPTADGYYECHYWCESGIGDAGDCYSELYIYDQIIVGKTSYWELPKGPVEVSKIGIIEFNIASLYGLFNAGQMQALLSLTVNDGDLMSDRCLLLYSIQDENENGVIEVDDVDTSDYIDEVCRDLQPGDTITFDVTPALEHDLFDSDQTEFTGFVLDRSTNWSGFIEFYYHTDLVNAPRLSIINIYSDFDEDGISDNEDNCPDHPNGPARGICTEIIADNFIVSNGQYCTPATVDVDCDDGEYCEISQEDNYPPGGNGIGDACDCEGNFDCDDGVTSADVGPFLDDWNHRTIYSNPCTNEDPCTGDFNCDGGVGSDDVGKFLEDWNQRNTYDNPCPPCSEGPWCVYP